MLTGNKLYDHRGGRSAVMKRADEVDPKGARLAAVTRENRPAADREDLKYRTFVRCGG